MRCLGCGHACTLVESCGPMWDYKCLTCGALNQRLQTIHGTYSERASHKNGWSCRWKDES
jgi:DNA-directed RNA polymerase subunit RPC12/RpoP